MNYWYLAAAAGMAVIWAIHTFVGGREVAAPLRRVEGVSDLQRWVLWYCWHLVTVTLAGLALALAVAGIDLQAGDLGLGAALLVLAFGIFGLILPKRVGQSLRSMPQGLLLTPVGIVALIGAFS